jgi:hypothetical protein
LFYLVVHTGYSQVQTLMNLSAHIEIERMIKRVELQRKEELIFA